MALQSLISILFLSFISSSSLLLAQQPYTRATTADCGNADKSSSVLGYTCNGQTPTCQSYLIFRSQPPYNTPSSISSLLSSDPSQLSSINSFSDNETIQTNKQVIVPVNCSCSGQYSQYNSSYSIKSGDSYLIVANDTYQGLSTCQALQAQNRYSPTELIVGMEIRVPLRCACPTRNQSSEGVKYLLSYVVNWGDDVPIVSQRFGVSMQNCLDANGLSLTDSTIHPFTTFLIPLQNPPNISMTIVPPPPSPPPPLPPSPTSGNGSKKTWVFVVISIAAVSLVLIASIISFCIYCRRKKHVPIRSVVELDKDEKPCQKSAVPEELLVGISDIGHVLKVYKFEELELATENFSSRIEGSVYRGVMKGDVAAIKKMNGDASKEIEILKQINHFNLIRLSGICFDGGHWYLVYEYAENGPLSDWIYNRSGSKVLSWTQRVQIAFDVASGLNYLHSFTEPAHVHKDIKSSNILLDGDFRAKIANFSSMRSVEGQEGRFDLTRHIVGTKGYMAPEYLENGLISPKLDVYAFGVVMLEMITGREAVVRWAGGDLMPSEALIALLGEGNAKEKLTEFIDPALEGNYPLDLALNVARLIEWCLKKEAAIRPNMDEIERSLSMTLSTSLTWELSNSSTKFPSFETDTEM
ncbi:lysM domain receptor-like kinase 4 [Magnolia sinica]|uniref:lysM domain receptor-like kinase 4 n=1 Tax=Magnolia sinica TaxID=86752 RepID=UPI00265859D3|nr:lysM domain receptor-like kinase 4 [Magnolia sinica]